MEGELEGDLRGEDLEAYLNAVPRVAVLLVSTPAIFLVTVIRIERDPKARLILERARYIVILVARPCSGPIFTPTTKTVRMRMLCAMAPCGRVLRLQHARSPRPNMPTPVSRLCSCACHVLAHVDCRHRVRLKRRRNI